MHLDHDEMLYSVLLAVAPALSRADNGIAELQDPRGLEHIGRHHPDYSPIVSGFVTADRITADTITIPIPSKEWNLVAEILAYGSENAVRKHYAPSNV